MMAVQNKAQQTPKRSHKGVRKRAGSIQPVKGSQRVQERSKSTCERVASDSKGRWLRPGARQVLVCVGAACNTAQHVGAFAVKRATAEGLGYAAQARSARAAGAKGELAQCLAGN